MEPSASPRWSVGALPRFFRDHTFRSLKHRDYRLYFFGQIVSFTGSWMQNAALAWYVYKLTGNPIWPQLLLIAQVGPTFLFGTIGGALADRFPKRKFIFYSQFAFLLNAVVMLSVVSSGSATPYFLLGVQLINGIIQSLDLPARLAFVPDLIPRSDLINAISLNSLLFNSARAIGPAMTGLIFLQTTNWGFEDVARVGTIACLGFNVLSYAGVLWSLSQISAQGQTTPSREKPKLLDGLRFILSKPWLTLLLVLTGMLASFGWPASQLLPHYVVTGLHLAETEYSLLLSAMGGGALCAALTNATFANEARRGMLLLGGAILTAIGLFSLAMAQTGNLAAVAAACIGFGLVLYLSNGQSTIQLSVPDGQRGKVMALWAMTLSGSAPVGNTITGLAAQHYPIRIVLTGMATGATLVTVGIAAMVFFRHSKRFVMKEPIPPTDATLPPS